MEESENSLPKVEFPLSDLTAETADSFRALALSQKKDYTVRIESGLSCIGSPDAIRQLVSLLLDNAMKYSPEGGKITLDLARHKKAIRLSVCSTTAEPLSQEVLSHLFDRFYRADTSRNSTTGGHGIGLSTAQAIVAAHGGKISAQMKDGDMFCISVSLPA
ncbi:MAG: GHKL domain-containing protein [Eubacterium sp.]|nr:GHKL domain-containing protein [Eubacterium sp.]